LLLAACSTEETTPPSTEESTASETIERQDFPTSALQALEQALLAYEEIRGSLAQNRHEDLADPAFRLKSAVDQAAGALGEDFSPRVRETFTEASRTAASLGAAPDLQTARQSFGEVSRLLLTLAEVDPRLLEGWHVFSCPMTSTYPKWIQRSAELENPYMGTGMTTCGVETESSAAGPDSTEEAQAHADAAHGDEIAYYTCAMHPFVRRHEPGQCPICSMDLLPVTRQEVESGVVTLTPQRRQAIGIRTAVVERRPVSIRTRAVGKIVYDETRLAEVTVKYRGWVGELRADATGVRVRRGEPLFTLYSPELYAAQEELFTAVGSQRAASATSAPERADYLVEAARQRLRLWDIEDPEIEEILAGGEPQKYLPILSPVDGYVIEKGIVRGAAVEPGRVLYRIAGLDRIWIDAEVYESELPLVRIGQAAEVTLPYLPGKSFRGTVSFMYPYLADETRTVRIRVELPNPGLELKPDMYANVELLSERGEQLVVPEEAVLYTGPRRLVFLDLGEGRLRPQEIQVGAKSGDFYEVLSGLEEGELVVTSGNFLVAAESRLKSALHHW
jgi:Cu(I)/Ag(I) efflux system membrane fusion protein